jgi:uncharacterized protein YoxC
MASPVRFPAGVTAEQLRTALMSLKSAAERTDKKLRVSASTQSRLLTAIQAQMSNDMAARLEQGLGGLNSGLSAAQSTVAGLEQQVATVRTRVDATSSSLADLTSTANGLSSSLDSLTSTVDGLTSSFDDLTGRVTALEAKLAVHSQILTTPVDVVDPATWYDAVSVALDPGTWLLTAMVTMRRATTTAWVASARLWDGSTALASSSASVMSATNSTITLPLMTVATLDATKTVKAQGYASNVSTTTIQHQNAPEVAGATQLHAVRLA